MPLTVLMVEDNPMNRTLFRDILEIRFDVIEAGSAEIALELLETTIPDLIVLDVELPGISGIELALRLKADRRLRKVPIVGLSAHAMPRNRDEALTAGCVEYVTKPLVEDPLEFVDRMARLAEAKA